MIAAGIGVRRACGAEEIVALVRRATATLGRNPALLAAPSFKRDHPGLLEAAAALDLPLAWIEDAAIEAAQPFCATRSAIAARATGIPSVAEGSAIAAAGPGARLVLPRIASAAATCALAEGAS